MWNKIKCFFDFHKWITTDTQCYIDGDFRTASSKMCCSNCNKLGKFTTILYKDLVVYSDWNKI
jgi:hypothetical protein